MKKFKSFKLDKIISIILVFVLAITTFGVASSLLSKKTKTVSNLEFKVGAVNEQGEYVNSTKSIYTENLIECQGLSIEPDFEATGTFQVFYYSDSKAFIGKTDSLNASSGVYNKGDSFVAAKYCRIVITPEAPAEDYSSEDFKIYFYDVYGYANDYKISVNKNQSFDLIKKLEKSGNLFKEINGAKSNGYGETGMFTHNTTSDEYFFDYVATADKNHVYIKAPVEILTTLINQGDGNYIHVPIIYTVNKNVDGSYSIVHDGLENAAQIYNDGEIVVFMYELNTVSHVFGFVDEASFNSGEMGVYVD